MEKKPTACAKGISLKRCAALIVALAIGASNLLAQIPAANFPPSCVITMPHTNAYFKENTDVLIRVFATDLGKTQNNGTVTSVKFYNGNILLGEATAHDQNSFIYLWECVPEGLYTITAEATNNRGVSFTSAGVEITVGTRDVTPRGMSACKGKYLANIIGGTPQDYYEPNMPADYMTFWNGISAENAHKWGDIFPSANGSYNWSKSDAVYKFAEDNNLMFRWHAIAWGSQYPSDLPCNNVTQFRQLITHYMQEIKRKYKHIDQFDVLNENMHGAGITHNSEEHAAGTPCFRSGLGGPGTTGHDWAIWAFCRGQAYFPKL
jgi:hypothetical protein